MPTPALAPWRRCCACDPRQDSPSWCRGASSGLRRSRRSWWRATARSVSSLGVTPGPHRGRRARLIDADTGAGAVAALLRVRPAPGLAELVSGRIEWPSAITQVLVARDRTIDVIAGGDASALPPGAFADHGDGVTGAL